MNKQSAPKYESVFDFGPFGRSRKSGVKTRDASTPALPKFLEKDLAQRPAEVRAFNSPKVAESKILHAKRDRDFQVIEAFVAVSYRLPLDGVLRTRRVLATLRIGSEQSRKNARASLISQAEEFFVLMVKAGRESMFPAVRTH